MTRKKRQPAPAPVTRIEAEFYGGDSADPSRGVRDAAHFDGPSAFNGIVRVRRQRIIVEVIDEPAEVICERLRALWRNCDNHNHSWPLQAEAKKYGLTLDHGEFGRDRRKAP